MKIPIPPPFPPHSPSPRRGFEKNKKGPPVAALQAQVASRPGVLPACVLDAAAITAAAVVAATAAATAAAAAEGDSEGGD